MTSHAGVLLRPGSDARLPCSIAIVPRPCTGRCQRSVQSLTAIVGPQSSLTRDTNGDGLADSVAARVIVPAAPTLGEMEAATNLAARLGYETTALTLPLVIRDQRRVEVRASIGVPDARRARPIVS